ncbi:putative major facilitator superfamily transporter [Rosellinia necatrix]|uniref:Putative major facilitator superfamily transporter n=1 Tax=Rosellinia necatrix TaxID=77044 RepID=A0A1W2TCS5_ROSNE|nr:putative major facilitator superfamily transporter [Rosellinia necatrix]
MADSDSSDDRGADDLGHSEHPDRYLKGYRLAVAILGLGIAVFLPTAEASIVSTSLVTISKDLAGYGQSSWIVTSYLLTYTGFIVIWSKLSDVVGLRPSLLVSAVLFAGFSAGCGSARSITQLIIFRAFQGMGGAGFYTLPTISMFQLVPASRYSQVNTISSSFMATALLLGPIIGGAISEAGNWRWIFFLILPASAVSMVLVFSVLPSRFPHHCDDIVESKTSRTLRPLYLIKKVDALGAFLLLSASILLVTALEEGGSTFPWRSAAIIVFFVLSGSLWIGFFLWESFASREESEVDPTFPRNFFSNRIFLGVLFGCFLSGVPLIVAVIELPQRYQIVNAASPVEAGTQLLAYAATLPLGIVTSNTATGRLRVPFIYPLLVGATLQTLGFALLSTLPSTLQSPPAQYGYSVLSGIGMGVSVGAFYVISPIAVEKKYQHLAVGAVLQARLLGSAVGIAIVSSILTDYVKNHLDSVLPDSRPEDLLQSATNLSRYPPDVQAKFRDVYGTAFNLQMKATVAFCAAQFLTVILIWTKRPLRLAVDGTLAQ